MERKIGTVYSSNPKGFVFIYVSPIEKYFAHIENIKADHLPVVGERVAFEVEPPRKRTVPGRLPFAKNVCIENVTGLDVLAGSDKVGA